MTPKQAQKWAAALRSGKYKQGTGSLVRTNCWGQHEFCVLGVLREINNDRSYAKFMFGRECIFGESITTLNDVGPIDYAKVDALTFDEIADLIELKFVHGAEG